MILISITFTKTFSQILVLLTFYHQMDANNRLRRRWQPDKADVVAQKINTVISNDKVHRLSKLNSATTKELWAAVNKVRNTRQDDGLAILHNPDTVNKYFAKIASKENYDPRKRESFMCECDDNNFEPSVSYTHLTLPTTPYV